MASLYPSRLCCIYDVVVVLILAVIPVVDVDRVIDVVNGHVILYADIFKLDVDFNHEVCL